MPVWFYKEDYYSNSQRNTALLLIDLAAPSFEDHPLHKHWEEKNKLIYLWKSFQLIALQFLSSKDGFSNYNDQEVYMDNVTIGSATFY